MHLGKTLENYMVMSCYYIHTSCPILIPSHCSIFFSKLLSHIWGINIIYLYMLLHLLDRGKNLPCIYFTAMAALPLNPGQSVCERICLSKWKESIFSFRFQEVITLKIQSSQHFKVWLLQKFSWGWTNKSIKTRLGENCGVNPVKGKRNKELNMLF